MSEIYLDNAATTPISDEVLAEMTDKYKHVFGNASTQYGLGRVARTLLEESRHTVAQSINANDNEVIFTSGGTESDNTAIIQTAMSRQNLGKHIITTAVEHQAVLQPMAFLEGLGFEVTYLPVDKNGAISLTDFQKALRPDTILVSIMMANNEVGTVMPIQEVGALLADHQAWFHTDAVQAYGLLDIDVKGSHIDLLSTSAHKINGPKMMGFLYRREGISFPSFLKGGEQEEKRRAGTENVPGVVGFATAVKNLTSTEKRERRDKYNRFKQAITNGLEANEIDFEVNGFLNDQSLASILNLWFKGVATDVLQTNLDLAGIAVSGGSACTAGSLEPSHVLTAMFGSDSPQISESIRISFGRYTTNEEVEEVVNTIAAIINRLKTQRGGPR